MMGGGALYGLGALIVLEMFLTLGLLVYQFFWSVGHCLTTSKFSLGRRLLWLAAMIVVFPLGSILYPFFNDVSPKLRKWTRFYLIAVGISFATYFVLVGVAVLGPKAAVEADKNFRSFFEYF